jgi:hypothetical protein
MRRNRLLSGILVAFDINDNGLAVGAVSMANQSSHAAKWPKGGGLSDLNLVGQ